MRKLLPPLFGILAAVFILTAFCDCSMNQTTAQLSAEPVSEKHLEAVPVLPADSPAIISPNYDFSTYENIIYLQWTSVVHCKNYEVQTSRKSDFSDTTNTYQTSDTLFAFNGEGLMRGVVFWKVRSKYENNEYSAWSEISRFTLLGRIDTDLTPDDRIVAPCNGNCGSCTRPCGRRRPVEPDI